MQRKKIVQSVLTVGILAVGGLVAARGYAVTSCQSGEIAWGGSNSGDASPPGACSGHIWATSRKKGDSDATLYVNALNDQGGSVIQAQAVGINSSHSPISGCSVTDTTANGTSVTDSTGCQAGVTFVYAAQWN